MPLKPLDSETRLSTQSGHVTIVGAGPGTSDYLTIGGLRALESADVVLYDALVDQSVLDLASPTAQMIPVGKRCGDHIMPQDMINRQLVTHASRGHHVVRLKGGDPFIFGRGSEEVEALDAAGIPVHVIPGISTAMAAAAELKRPLMHRGVARRLTIATGTCKTEQETQALSWAADAADDTTLALYMAREHIGRIADRIIAAGKDPETPCILVENVGRSDRREIVATLGSIETALEKVQLNGPTIALIGKSLDRGSAVCKQTQAIVPHPEHILSLVSS